MASEAWLTLLRAAQQSSPRPWLAALRACGSPEALIERALDYFRAEGLAVAVIETMSNNEKGQHLYPSCGFVEIARQIHFAMKL